MIAFILKPIIFADMKWFGSTLEETVIEHFCTSNADKMSTIQEDEASQVLQKKHFCFNPLATEHFSGFVFFYFKFIFSPKIIFCPKK